MSQIQVPKGWEIKQLGNKEYFLDIISGGTPSRQNSTYYGGNIPWVRLGDMKVKYLENTSEQLTADGLKKLGDRIIPKGAVILSTRATIGEVAISNVDLCTNQGFKSIVCNQEKILPEYLYYFFKSIKQFLITKGNTTTFPEVNKTTLMSITVPVPSTKIQKKIIQKLDYILEQLEEKVKNIENIHNRIKKNIDLFSEHNDIIIISKLLSDSLFSSENQTETIADVLESKLQGLYYNKGYFDSGIPLLRITDLGKNGKIDYSSIPKIHATENEIKRFSLKKGDLIVARTGGAGRSAIFDKENFTLLFAGYLIRFRFFKKINPYFVRICMRHPYNLTKIATQIHGSSNQNLNAENIKKLKIPKLGLDEQNKIVSEFNKGLEISNSLQTNFTSSLVNLDKTRKYLSHLKSSILEQAFTGKLVN